MYDVLHGRMELLPKEMFFLCGSFERFLCVTLYRHLGSDHRHPFPDSPQLFGKQADDFPLTPHMYTQHVHALGVTTIYKLCTLINSDRVAFGTNYALRHDCITVTVIPSNLS